MTDFCSRDFCKLSVQEAADMLLDKLHENIPDGKPYSMAKLHGCSDGRMFELCLVMKEVDDES